MDAALNWDEFRLVKAIADSRSLAGAADVLGLNHSTVFRRLGALEAVVGAPLFERSRSGYDPTAAGDEMIALANQMSDSIVDFERRVAGRDAKPTGRLTVTTVDAIGQRFMPSILSQFQAQNPGVVIDLILSERELNLSPAGRGRRDPGDQRPARDAGRPAHLHGALGPSTAAATSPTGSGPARSTRCRSPDSPTTSGPLPARAGSNRTSARSGSPRA